MSLKSKCYKCEKRYVGCHSNCNDYKEYRKALDVINIRRNKIKEDERMAWRCNHGKPI